MRIGCSIFAIAAALAGPAAAATATLSGVVSATGGVAPATVVYVEKGPDPAPRAAPARKEMEQKDTEFQPRALWVRAGDTVQFTNRDNFYHNVFSPGSESGFDLGLYRGGVAKTVELAHPGEIEVYCNIHPNMKAKVLVVPDERAAQVAADGSYSLAGLAPGDYTIVAWSPAHEPVRREIHLRAGEAAKADFSLKPRGTPAAHLNKYGEQYGRYR